MTHISVGKRSIIGSDNGLSPGQRKAIIWTSTGILLIGPLGTNFSEISNGIQTFSFKKMHLKMSSAKWRPFCVGLNVLIKSQQGTLRSLNWHEPLELDSTLGLLLPRILSEWCPTPSTSHDLQGSHEFSMSFRTVLCIGCVYIMPRMFTG